MEIKKDVLQKVAETGSGSVAQAFSKLSGSQAQVDVSKVEKTPLDKCLEHIKPGSEQGIVVYSQVLSAGPVKGVALMTMKREDALTLVDLLNQQEIGTIGILKDIDRSAIKETLNILSNAYMTTLAENVGLEINIEVPNMITSSRLSDIVDIFLGDSLEDGAEAVLFETVITITSHEVKTSLYLIFNNKLAELVKG